MLLIIDIWSYILCYRSSVIQRLIHELSNAVIVGFTSISAPLTDVAPQNYKIRIVNWPFLWLNSWADRVPISRDIARHVYVALIQILVHKEDTGSPNSNINDLSPKLYHS